YRALCLHRIILQYPPPTFLPGIQITVPIRSSFSFTKITNCGPEISGISAIEVPAHGRGATMGDRPDGPLPRFAKNGMFFAKAWQEPTEHVDNRPGHRALVRQIAREFLDQCEGVLLALMSEVQINHGGGDLAVTEELLHRM